MDGEVAVPAAADREVTVQVAEADYAVVVAPVIAPDSLNKLSFMPQGSQALG